MGLLVYLVIFFPVAAFTGGVAGAIVGGGREDRPIWKNGVIGIVGWTVASIVIGVVTGSSPEELTFGFGVLALLASIGFILLDKWRERRSESAADAQDTVNSST